MHRQRKTTTGRRFFLNENDAFPSQDKRNTRDKAEGLRDYFGEAYRGAGHAMP